MSTKKWLWAIKCNGSTTTLFPGKPLTAGKNTECVIKIGARATKTSKNVLTFTISPDLTSLAVNATKGCTMKAYAGDARITPSKPQELYSDEKLTIEKETFSAEFMIRKNITIRTSLGLKKSRYPKDWTIETDEELMGTTEISDANGKKLFSLDDTTMTTIDEGVKSAAVDNTFKIPAGKAGGKAKTGAGKKRKAGGDVEIREVEDMVKPLSKEGLEDLERIQHHMNTKATLPKNYKTRAQELLYTISIEEKENVSSVRKIQMQPSQQKHTIPRRRQRVFKQKKVQVYRANFVYDD